MRVLRAIVIDYWHQQVFLVVVLTLVAWLARAGRLRLELRLSSGARRWLRYSVIALGLLAVIDGRPFGSINIASAALAVVAVSWWPLWAPAAFVLWWFNTVGALVAFAAGLVWTVSIKPYRYQVTAYTARVVSIAFVTALLGTQWYWYRLLKGTFYSRLEAWQRGLADWTWTTLLIGHGFGAWRVRVGWYDRNGELWPWACNELIEWFYATGLLGTVPALLLLWCVRRVFVDRVWGGALVALVITAMVYPSFHAPVLVWIALVALSTQTGRP